MGNNSGNGFGFSIGGSGGGGGTNTNIANSDLTLDANRTTDVGSNTLTFDSGSDNIAQFNGSTNKVIFGPSGDDYTFPDERPTAAGQVLAAADTSGNLEWAAQTDTNTNIANTNLTLTNNRTLSLNSLSLSIQQSGTNRAAAFSSTGVTIGSSTAGYTLPTSRPSAAGLTISSTNAAGGMAFKRGGFQLPFTMFIQGYAANTWHYPEPITNNKFLALIRSSGIEASVNLETGWNQLTSTTLRSCTLGSNAFGTVATNFNAWCSTLDNTEGSALTPTVTLKIFKFTPQSGVTDQLLPTELLSGTSIATGNSNNKWYLIRNGSTGVTQINANDLLMPVLKLDFGDEVPDTINFDVYLNGSVYLYYS